MENLDTKSEKVVGHPLTIANPIIGIDTLNQLQEQLAERVFRQKEDLVLRVFEEKTNIHIPAREISKYIELLTSSKGAETYVLIDTGEPLITFLAPKITTNNKSPYKTDFTFEQKHIIH